MGKIVKYCSSCDEGFAERFGFCPDCGAPLQAFEMNPVSGDMVPEVKAEDSSPASYEFQQNEAEVFESPADPVDEFVTEPELVSFADDDGDVEAEPIHKAITAEVPAYDDEDVAYDDNYPAAETSYSAYSSNFDDSYVPDDDYHVTVIEEKNVQQRNGLLLGATVLMIGALMVGTVYSLFNKDLGVGAIGEQDILAYVGDIVEDPMKMIEEEEQKKKDDAGGGGGGGDEDPNPASKGQLPKMMKDPDIAPSVHMDRLTNPTLTQRVGVQGPDINQKIDPNTRYGIDTSVYDGLSNGPGTGGGIGTGRGGGVGSGRDSGIGSGSGGGMGSGSDGGIGDGTGVGTRGGAPPPPSGVTTGLSIISKPRPGYTDPARQNQVQGTVILKVTFLASGQIGNISTVKGLPNGLTEQAIAAARRITFKPKMKNGIPIASIRNVEYSFTIY